MIETTQTQHLKYFENALIKQIISDVEKYLWEQVHENLDTKIKKIAIEAVGKWATKINTSENIRGMDRITEVQVNFVEEVVNKVFEENTVKVSVNE
jgi:hypothetical protein